MKITCIVGSARDDGSCAYLVDKFIEGIGGNAEVRRYFIGRADLRFCRGCKACYLDGECVQQDDAKGIVLDLLSSDYAVIAAPSYWAGVPAQLKTLFDRSTPYGDTNPNRKYMPRKGIKGVAIAVRAGVNDAENQLILNCLQHYFGHLGIETVKRVSIRETDALCDLLQKRQSEIEEIKQFAKTLSTQT